MSVWNLPENIRFLYLTFYIPCKPIRILRKFTRYICCFLIQISIDDYSFLSQIARIHIHQALHNIQGIGHTIFEYLSIFFLFHKLAQYHYQPSIKSKFYMSF